MRKRFGALAGLVGILAVAASFSAASASANGCTPGYWKNHTDVWNEGVAVSTVFSAAPGTLGTESLLDALQGGGGPTLLAKKQILLRAAVAAYLNYTQQAPGVFYTQFSGAFGADGVQETVGEFQTLVNTALGSSDAASILLLASHIDFKNNENETGLCGQAV